MCCEDATEGRCRKAVGWNKLRAVPAALHCFFAGTAQSLFQPTLLSTRCSLESSLPQANIDAFAVGGEAFFSRHCSEIVSCL
jgi:hypothetical protein